MPKENGRFIPKDTKEAQSILAEIERLNSLRWQEIQRRAQEQAEREEREAKERIERMRQERQQRNG